MCQVGRRTRNGITTRLAEGTGWIELHGELDITAVVFIENAVLDLIDRAADRVVVDFADASFVDSKAIEALMRAARSARAAGVEPAATGATGPLVRVLDVCGLDRAMPVCATRAEALAATGAPGASEH